MPEMDIDKLQITIDTELGNSVNNLESLTTTLKKLKRVSKGAEYSNLVTQLNKISSVDLTGISGQLNTLASSLSVLKKAPQMKDIFKPDSAVVNSLEEMTDQLSVLASVPIQPIAETLNDFTTEAVSTNNGIEMLRQGVSSAATSFQWLEKEVDDTSNAFIKIKSASKDASENLNFGSWYMKKVGEESEKSGGKLGKFFDALKRIALYRAVRAILKNIASAFREGMENVARYSEKANNYLSQIKTSSLQVKNSLGALFASSLSAITPILKQLSDWFVSVANNLNMMFAVMRGQTTYTKAIEYWQDYADALKKVKAATIGIDELNVIGNNEQNDVSKMFEEANVTELSPFYTELKNTLGFIKEHFEAIAIAIGTIVALNFAVKVGSWVTAVGKLITPLFKTESGFGGISRAILAAGGVIAAFTLARDGADELSRYLAGDDNASLTGSLLSLTGGAIGAVATGAAIGGPIGAVIGGVAYLAGALVGIGDAQKKMRLKEMREEFYKGKTSIDDIIESLGDYFKALDFDTNKEWIDSVNSAKDAYDKAESSFTTMWNALKDREQFSTDDISNLSTAFSNLAGAVKALNDAKIGSLMQGINSAITKNITPDLTSNLTGMLDKIYEAQAFIDSKVTGINAQYQRILNDITASGGQVTSEQKTQLADLRKQMASFTLGVNVNSSIWSNTAKDISKTSINAGSSLEDVKANIDKLKDDFKPYTDDITNKYNQDRATLEALIEMDKNQFGGALGFTGQDLKTLQTSYETQLAGVQGKFNSVIEQLIAQYTSSKGFIDYRSLMDEINAYGKNHTMAQVFNKYSAKSEIAQEQKDLIEYLKSVMLTPQTTSTNGSSIAGGGNKRPVTMNADGGFIPRGDLFYANENGTPEYLGTMGNRTTVANNNQIIEGIKRGVSEANNEERALLREQNNILRSLLEKETSITIGDETIGKANARYVRTRGATVSKGAFADAY